MAYFLKFDFLVQVLFYCLSLLSLIWLKTLELLFLSVKNLNKYYFNHKKLHHSIAGQLFLQVEIAKII